MGLGDGLWMRDLVRRLMHVTDDGEIPFKLGYFETSGRFRVASDCTTFCKIPREISLLSFLSSSKSNRASHDHCSAYTAMRCHATSFEICSGSGDQTTR